MTSIKLSLYLHIRDHHRRPRDLGRLSLVDLQAYHRDQHRRDPDHDHGGRPTGVTRRAAVTDRPTASELWRAVMAEARGPAEPETLRPPARPCRRVRPNAGCARCGAEWNMKYPYGVCECPGGPFGPWPPPDPDWVSGTF